VYGEPLIVEFGDRSARVETLCGADVEYDGDDVEFAPEPTADFGSVFDETGRDARSDEFHQVFWRKNKKMSGYVLRRRGGWVEVIA
jgi:hypothetical protein